MVPSYLLSVPAGTGLVVGQERLRQPSTCWINMVTCLAPFLWMQIIGMAIIRGIVKIVPRQTAGISQGFYLKAIGIRFTVGLESLGRKFLPQLVDDLLANMSRELSQISSVYNHFS
jgi:hypothetical protein